MINKCINLFVEISKKQRKTNNLPSNEIQNSPQSEKEFYSYRDLEK